ncbi:MAG: DUF2867 domain-containing protein [Pseudomonadota bacterium]
MGKKILVFGATKYVGRHLVLRLQALGHRVRAADPCLETMEACSWCDVELVIADALDPSSLVEAMEGMDVVYYLTAVSGVGHAPDHQIRQVEQNFRAAAAKTRVRHIIFLQPLSRVGQEDSVNFLESLGDATMTDLRVGPILGAESLLFEIVRILAHRHDYLSFLGRSLYSAMRPIALHDLMECLLRVMENPDLFGGKSFLVVGPENTSLESLVRSFTTLKGWCWQSKLIPVLTEEFLTQWLMAVAIPIEMIALMGYPVGETAGQAPFIHHLTALPLANCIDAMEIALMQERNRFSLAHWVEGIIPFHGYQVNSRAFSKRLGYTKETDVPIENLWTQVTSIGGGCGWYYQNWLWQLRGLMDLAAGGVGMTRGRPHPQDIRMGDTLDCYRVYAVEPGRRLTLAVEMRLPGMGFLEFELTPLGEQRSRISAVGYFQPSNILGTLYWNALVPIHDAVFKGLTHSIVERARVKNS